MRIGRSADAKGTAGHDEIPGPHRQIPEDFAVEGKLDGNNNAGAYGDSQPAQRCAFWFQALPAPQLANHGIEHQAQNHDQGGQLAHAHEQPAQAVVPPQAFQRDLAGGVQQQEQPQQNNDAPADNGSNNTQPDAKEVKFSTDDLLKNAADIISALGGSPITSTSPSCTSNGCDVKTYDYAGELKIQCYIDGGVEYFFDYDILGGNYATSKGIKVGSSRADVEAAYGTGEESGNMLIYTDGDKQLIFTMNGDTVSEIDFYVPV